MTSSEGNDFIARASEEFRNAKTQAPSSAPRTRADKLLEEVGGVLRQRRENYGPPDEHFARTVGMINALFAHKLKEPLTPHEWAQIMLCDKLSRHQERPIWDNCVDAVGYSALLGETFPRE